MDPPSAFTRVESCFSEDGIRKRRKPRLNRALRTMETLVEEGTGVPC